MPESLSLYPVSRSFMNVADAVEKRRTIRVYESREPSRETVESLLASAILVPNHRITRPWRFYVMGAEARAAYGLALGNRKAKKAADEAAANAMRERTSADHRAIPCMVAFAMTQSDNPEIQEEDYASVMMAVNTFALVAVENGLGTHIKTGAVMNDPAARIAIGVPDNERVVAVVNLGYPAETPAAREPVKADAFTTWSN